MTPGSDTIPTPSTFALTVQQAAVELQVSEEKVKQLIQTGDLRAFRIGRLYRIERSALEEYAVANLVH